MFEKIRAKLSGNAAKVEAKASEPAAKGCSHAQDHIKAVKPQTKGCEECLKTGDKWVHLRMCLECGHVGCCDSSKGRHARGHFHETQHPIMQSAERGENWRWCYIDDKYLD